MVHRIGNIKVLLLPDNISYVNFHLLMFFQIPYFPCATISIACNSYGYVNGFFQQGFGSESDNMGMDQYLYVRYYVHDSKTYGGSPVDIPLSAQPICGKRHFEKVDYVFSEILYWRKDQIIDAYMRTNSKAHISEDCGYVFVEVKRSAIIDLRDELLRIAKGEKSELFDDEPDFYARFDEDGKDIVLANKHAQILDNYLHDEDDDLEFFYRSSW